MLTLVESRERNIARLNARLRAPDAKPPFRGKHGSVGRVAVHSTKCCGPSSFASATPQRRLRTRRNLSFWHLNTHRRNSNPIYDIPLPPSMACMKISIN